MIKNIVFDFGGILLDLDQAASFNAFSTLIGEKITKEDAHLKLGNAFIELEKGNISNESFIWKFQHLKGGNMDPVKIIKAWNAMLLRIQPTIFPFLLDVKQKYRTILLSNTNAIHIEHVTHRMLERNHGIRDWDRYFHAIYYSHDMNMRKPDYEIYHKLIEEENIDPSETLFIDDTKENVEAAIACGWNSIQHDPAERIENKLEEYIARYGAK